MKTINRFGLGILSIALLASAWSWANEAEHPTSAPAWNPISLRQALAAMPSGDALRGKELNSQYMCASCHGDNGVAPTNNWPNTAGQKADYTYKMLLDYKSGLRSEDKRSKLMQAAVEPLTAQDMADLAAYYASLPLPATPAASSATLDLNAAEKLVRKGDPTRLITPCASCHGVKGQGGKNAAPALAGQSEKAFVRTMQLYKHGERVTDVNKGMAQIAVKLTDEEIRQLAAYYQRQ